jgi:NAD(P)-dependent dehydrogenase (short-subunit alcohol dehydrogenase family)
MRDLSAKAALVTGGASGLGRAIAQRLVTHGATVVITDLQQEIGRATAAECDVSFILQDVRDEARWPEVIEEVEQRHGSLDILVNNAGVAGPVDAVSPEDTRLGDWKDIFAVNVEGVFLGCRAALPAMRRAGSGSIINLSSIAGLVATPDFTAYGASKAAVWHLTKSVAKHCTQAGLAIRCNSVHPGVVRTPLWEHVARESARLRSVSMATVLEETREEIPMGEFTAAQDVAGAVAFLASDEARHITGSEVLVDGGYINCR